jgi:hypothetical protein
MSIFSSISTYLGSIITKVKDTISSILSKRKNQDFDNEFDNDF